MIDLTKPISVFDDRSKIDTTLVVSEVLWADSDHAMVRTVVKPGEKVNEDFALSGDPDQPFLLDLNSGHVMNSDYDSWIAENVHDGKSAEQPLTETTQQRVEQESADWRAANTITDWEFAEIGQLLCDHDPRDVALMLVRLQGKIEPLEG